MGAYLSPGVYVEEVPASIRPIEGVGTSVAGFVGIIKDSMQNNMPLKPDSSTDRYSLAQAKIPMKITSWENFKNSFGDFHEDNKILAHAVYGFFNNGGTACWVTRINDAADYQEGFDSFKPIDEITIVAAPGAVDVGIQTMLVNHCVGMKDRFAVVDGQQLSGTTSGYTKAAITTDADSNALANIEDGYGAVYFPWIKVYDSVSKDYIYVPPSGYIAGIYARSDSDRGVHKAPANEVIRGAIGLEHNLSKADQDGLNPDGINIIRSFNNNITVWGARTFADTSTSPEWKYISTRRLVNFIRESIEEGTRWVVFEPNDLALWQKIKRNINAFLTNVWRDGALFGAKPEQAFYVKCDEDTNPQEVRNLGRVVTEIGIAVTKPAEFVIFRISQWDGISN